MYSTLRAIKRPHALLICGRAKLLPRPFQKDEGQNDIGDAVGHFRVFNWLVGFEPLQL